MLKKTSKSKQQVTVPEFGSKFSRHVRSQVQTNDKMRLQCKNDEKKKKKKNSPPPTHHKPQKRTKCSRRPVYFNKNNCK